MFRTSFVLVLAMGCVKQSEPPKAAADAAPVEASAEVTDSASSPTTPGDGKWIHYGAQFSADATVSAKVLLDNPQDHMDGIIRVTDATITDVCQTKGCWLVIADGDRNMRIFTKDHAFVVAKDSGGSSCQLEGTVVSKVVKQEFVEHLEAESTQADSMPEKGKVEGDMVYEFVASAVRIDGQTQVSMPVGDAPAAPEATNDAPEATDETGGAE